MQKVIIAIDGPAASGKSSTARLLAQRLGYVYLDTGAMYRACALQAQREGLSLEDVDAIATMMDSINLRMDFAQEQNRVFLDDEDVSQLIRSESISKMSSAISALTPVRLKMVELQRRIAHAGGFILDGRDIGSYVFPDARIKFFLTADVDARAQRRLLELQAKGIAASFEDVRADLLQRDKNDRNRTLAPLVQADDAILIDTTLLTLEGQVDLLYQHVQKILGGL
ncbi:MAG: (d)CMP kinase [Candidatus Cloacimonetes bacterium]|nr:(d)CMP kinase [Candidatus Cloacimonadota bacterium]